MESKSNSRISKPESFLQSIVTLDDMVTETVDLIASSEKTTLDEVFRNIIDVPFLKDAIYEQLVHPEDWFSFH